MEVTKLIEVDLATRGVTNKVDVVQFDANTRIVKTVLYENGLPWNVPDGVQVVFSYKKPDKTVGMYDQMPDGSPAATVEENVIFLKLAPQVMTVKGVVHCNIVMYAADGDSLATFPINVLVAENQQAEVMDSVDYINMGYVQYDTQGKENVIPETTTTDSAVVNGSYSIVDGDAYIVLFNGEEFSCTAKYTYQSATVEYWDIRPSKSLSAEYPFYVRVYPSSWRLFLYDKTQSATVSVWKPVPQISSKHIATLPMSKVDGLEDALKNAGGGGQADWGQNDENGAGYVKNRTHYSYGEITEIFPETTIAVAEIEYGGACIFEPIGLVAGKPYTVKFNGVEYTKVALALDLDGLPVVLIGEEHVSSSCPFSIMELPPEIAAEMGGIYAAVTVWGGVESFTLAIYEGVQKTQKIDDKYINIEWMPRCNQWYLNSAFGEIAVEMADGQSSTYLEYNAHEFLSFSSAIGSVEVDVLKIIFDEVEYMYKYSRSTRFIFGNASLYDSAGENTGEPFCFVSGATSSAPVTLYCGVGTHTFSIVYGVTSKIPDRFLPELHRSSVLWETAGLEYAVTDAQPLVLYFDLFAYEYVEFVFAFNAMSQRLCSFVFKVTDVDKMQEAADEFYAVSQTYKDGSLLLRTHHRNITIASNTVTIGSNARNEFVLTPNSVVKAEGAVNFNSHELIPYRIIGHM